MVFFFFMVNAVFVLAIFLLQNNKDTIHIDWPFGGTVNMTYNGGFEVKSA
jgi:chitin synthase